MKVIDEIRGGSLPPPPALLDGLAEAFPLVDRMAATPQDPEWHAEGNVRIHTERVIDEIGRVIGKESEATGLGGDERLALVLGAALHDLGKTLTTREEERDGRVRIVSPYHTERGRSYLAPRMALLGLPWKVCEMVLSLVGHHHTPGKLVARSDPERRYRRLARAADPRLLYLLELADLRGRDRAAAGDEGRGFETLELFRIGAEDAGVWTGGDPYAEWRGRIAEKLAGADPEIVEYVIGEAVRDFEAGRIFTPEEAIARTYEWRESHPEVVITCGPSGSGKSTWVETECGDCERISLDELREELTGRRDNQSKNGQVMQLAKERFRQHLRDRKRIVWDATGLRADGRSMVVQLGHDYHARTRIVAFASPPDRVIARNRERKQAVSRSVLDRQYERLQWPEVWEAHRVDVVVSEDRS